MNKRLKKKITLLVGKEKVGFLANELIKAIQDCGYSLEIPKVEKNYASFGVTVFRYGQYDAELAIYCISNGWDIRAKPTFKLLENKECDE